MKTQTGPLTGGPLDRGFDYFLGNEAVWVVLAFEAVSLSLRRVT